MSMTEKAKILGRTTVLGLVGIVGMAGCVDYSDYNPDYNYANRPANNSPPAPTRNPYNSVPPGIYTGSVWIDGYGGCPKDGIVQSREIIEKGKLTYKTGDDMEVLGVIGPEGGRARLDLCDEETGQLFFTTGDTDFNRTTGALDCKRHFSPGEIRRQCRMTIKLIVDGREFERSTVTLVP